MSHDIGQEDSFQSKIASKAGLILPIAIGMLLVIAGIRIFLAQKPPDPKMVITANSAANSSGKIVVHIAGAVTNPGVYELANGSRTADLIAKAGGFAKLADQVWIDTTLNLALKLTDGMKLYIPIKQVRADTSEQSALSTQEISSNTSTKININQASKDALDTLSGVGPATADKIMTNRPYQTIDELLTKKVLSKSVFEQVKDKISVF
jgi:competence protein ComEA